MIDAAGPRARSTGPLTASRAAWPPTSPTATPACAPATPRRPATSPRTSWSRTSTCRRRRRPDRHHDGGGSPTGLRCRQLWRQRRHREHVGQHDHARPRPRTSSWTRRAAAAADRRRRAGRRTRPRAPARSAPATPRRSGNDSKTHGPGRARSTARWRPGSRRPSAPPQPRRRRWPTPGQRRRRQRLGERRRPRPVATGRGSSATAARPATVGRHRHHRRPELRGAAPGTRPPASPACPARAVPSRPRRPSPSCCCSRLRAALQGRHARVPHLGTRHI